MSSLEPLEQSLRNLLSCLSEPEAESASDNEYRSSDANEVNNSTITYADKMHTLYTIAMLKMDSVNSLSNHLSLLEEKEIRLHQMTAELVALAHEHDEAIHALQDLTKLFDRIEKQHYPLDSNSGKNTDT